MPRFACFGWREGPFSDRTRATGAGEIHCSNVDGAADFDEIALLIVRKKHDREDIVARSTVTVLPAGHQALKLDSGNLHQ